MVAVVLARSQRAKPNCRVAIIKLELIFGSYIREFDSLNFRGVNSLKHSGYQISRYQRDQMNEVVKLLHKNLWRDREPNFSYFQWKYHDNPYASEPLGVTATHDGAVVGFRGYFATSWYLGSKDNRVIILIPGDTVVHSEHRRKGLSVAMGNLAMERFAARYSVFLNMTAAKNSVPGYLRMGFAPLENKGYYRTSSLVKDAKVIWRAVLKKRKKVGDVPLCKSKISFGDFGDIVVSKSPRPEEMSRLASGKPEFPAKITPLQDQEFFRWRYENANRKYAFYFYRRGDAILGYLVMLLSDDIGQGFIVDYGQEGEGPIGRILDHIAEMAEFEEVNILNVSVDECLWETLKPRKFKRWGLRRSLWKMVRGEWPLLVRPIKRECSEDDWFLGGLDIRVMENWKFKHICGDAA